jgi:hypothetical protein
VCLCACVSVCFCVSVCNTPSPLPPPPHLHRTTCHPVDPTPLILSYAAPPYTFSQLATFASHTNPSKPQGFQCMGWYASPLREYIMWVGIVVGRGFMVGHLFVQQCQSSVHDQGTRDAVHEAFQCGQRAPHHGP